MDQCDQCGFDFDRVTIAEVPSRISAGVADLGGELRATAVPGYQKPTLPPDRWTSLAYGAHVRDVLLTIRDRTVVGLAEDYPAFNSMYREERISLGLYRLDTPDEVALELEAAANMFLRLLGAVDATRLDRLVQYGSPDPVDRSLGWMAKQAVHEIEHHLSDVRENAGN